MPPPLFTTALYHHRHHHCSLADPLLISNEFITAHWRIRCHSLANPPPLAVQSAWHILPCWCCPQFFLKWYHHFCTSHCARPPRFLREFAEANALSILSICFQLNVVDYYRSFKNLQSPRTLATARTIFLSLFLRFWLVFRSEKPESDSMKSSTRRF